MSVERCLFAKVRSWRNKKFNSIKALIVAFIVATIFFTINFNMILLSKFITVNATEGFNGTQAVSKICTYDDKIIIWAPVNCFFCFLIMINMIAV